MAVGVSYSKVHAMQYTHHIDEMKTFYFFCFFLDGYLSDACTFQSDEQVDVRFEEIDAGGEQLFQTDETTNSV